jgi:uncharacterized protein YdbL (DUF1318 family)
MKKLVKQSVLLVSIVMLSVSASALDLNSAKDQGLIGELGNGYLGLIAAGNEDAIALAKSINDKRKANYTEIAQKNKTSEKELASIMGKKLLKKAKAGQMIKQDGKWVKR